MWLFNADRALRYDKLFPELSNLPEHLWKQLALDSYAQLFLSPSAIAVHALYMSPLLGWGLCVVFLLPNNTPTAIIAFAVFVVLGIFTIEVSMPIHVRSRKRWIHLELNRKGIRPAACLMCSHDLRGMPDESTTCPECGAKIAAITDDINDVTPPAP